MPALTTITLKKKRFLKKTNFDREYLNQPFDNKS